MVGTSSVVLDTSSGGPLSGPTLAALHAAQGAGWIDPTLPTALSRRAADLRQAAHAALASGVGADPQLTRVVPGGGAALAAGLLGLLAGEEARCGAPPTLRVSTVEHSAALRVARWWAGLGHPVVTVPVDRLGRVDRDALVDGAGPGTVACVQLANGEVGTDHDASASLDQLAEAGAVTLLDATASVGWVPVPPGWSAVAAAATSWGGPLGTGVLAWAPWSPWRAPEPDLASEHPVALTVASASALESALAGRDSHAARARAQIARIREALPGLVPDLDVAGDPDRRLPHVLTVSALYCHGEALAMALDRQGLAVGSGSACANDSGEPSHVLAAMGVLTGGSIRLVLPAGCLDHTIDRFLSAYPEAIAEVREDPRT